MIHGLKKEKKPLAGGGKIKISTRDPRSKTCVKKATSFYLTCKEKGGIREDKGERSGKPK